MRSIALIVMSCLLASSAATSADCARLECEKTKQKIRKIQSQMRQGYTRARGERLEAELRRLRELRRKRCR